MTVVDSLLPNRTMRVWLWRETRKTASPHVRFFFPIGARSFALFMTALVMGRRCFGRRRWRIGVGHELAISAVGYVFAHMCTVHVGEQFVDCLLSSVFLVLSRGFFFVIVERRAFLTHSFLPRMTDMHVLDSSFLRSSR